MLVHKSYDDICSMIDCIVYSRMMYSTMYMYNESCVDECDMQHMQMMNAKYLEMYAYQVYAVDDIYMTVCKPVSLQKENTVHICEPCMY